MLFFTIRRLLQSLVVLLIASFAVYWLVAVTADPLAPYREKNPQPSQAFFDAKTKEFGLDRPIPERYFTWLGHFLTGNFGNDISGNPVKPQLFSAMGVTARLVIGAIVLAVVLAIVIGVYTAVRAGKAGDYIASFVAYLLIAIPVFWFAALLRNGAIAVNQLLGSNLIPVVNEETAGISLYESGWPLFQDRLLHLILPTISLAALNYAAWSRYQRATMLDVLNSDYLRLARAKGIPWLTVLRRHGLRNALIPVTTVVAIGAGALLSGAIVTETLFAWHGLGEFFLTALNSGDQNKLIAYLIVSAIFVILFNLIADLLYAVLDPRIRLS
ncbi:MAG: ABC transporter permease [Antricoccus sp.]